jgi:hypothetical protein
MASEPPQYSPPTGASAPTPPQPPPQRQTFLDRFRGLAWWELALVLLPLGLIFLGGLVGGVFGAIALLSNLAIARRPFSSGVKAALMIAVVVVAYLVVYAIAVIIYVARHRT